MRERVRVLVVEDSVLQQKGICGEIEKFEACNYFFDVGMCIKDARNAVICCAKGDFDLILMDVFTEGGETGLDAALRIKSMYPQLKIIMMTSTLERECLRRAKAIGCESFWQKDFEEPGLQKIMEMTMQGSGYYPNELPPVKIGNALSSDLSERELEILRELSVNGSNMEVAKRLSITVHTVKFHLRMIRDKTGLDSTLQVVAEAIKKGVIIPRIPIHANSDGKMYQN